MKLNVFLFFSLVTGTVFAALYDDTRAQLYCMEELDSFAESRQLADVQQFSNFQKEYQEHIYKKPRVIPNDLSDSKSTEHKLSGGTQLFSAGDRFFYVFNNLTVPMIKKTCELSAAGVLPMAKPANTLYSFRPLKLDFLPISDQRFSYNKQFIDNKVEYFFSQTPQVINSPASPDTATCREHVGAGDQLLTYSVIKRLNFLKRLNGLTNLSLKTRLSRILNYCQVNNNYIPSDLETASNEVRRSLNIAVPSRNEMYERQTPECSECRRPLDIRRSI